MQDVISSVVLSGLLVLTPFQGTSQTGLDVVTVSVIKQPDTIVASEVMDLIKRNQNKDVSEIFRDNILLNLHYIKGDAGGMSCHPDPSADGEGSQGDSLPAVRQVHEFGMTCVDWEKIREPFEFSLTLEPGELFAFHDELLPEFKDKKVKTGWTKFSVAEGYKVLDGLSGNGVCHLATLINWVSSKAGLEVTAKVSHDFYPVPGVDRKYGTSIVYIPGAYTTQMQNLYVVNPYPYPVFFHFKADNNRVELKIEK